MGKRIIRSTGDVRAARRLSELIARKAGAKQEEPQWFDAPEYTHIRILLNLILGHYDKRGKTYDELLRVLLDAIDSRIDARRKPVRRESRDQQTLFDDRETPNDQGDLGESS